MNRKKKKIYHFPTDNRAQFARFSDPDDFLFEPEPETDECERDASRGRDRGPEETDRPF